jgi:glucose/arabinose dehydrogenase
MIAKIIIVLFIIGGIVGFIWFYQRHDNSSTILERVVQSQNDRAIETIVTVAQNLEVPWEVVFLPDGQLLVTERPGSIQRIDHDGNVTVVETIDDVLHIGEGGLLGLALHPDFSENNAIYLYYTYAANGNNTMNRVVRYTYENNNRLSERSVIVDRIPGANNHNGGRIAFGPDGYLYITTGDAANPSLAQDRQSLAGKILRVTEEGKPAPGNPFNSPVYSYGHRNPQGLAWDDRGQLWATEHGPSAHDELNRIEQGQNYGWPTIQGDQERSGMQSPVMQSGNETWAPAGLTYYDGILYFTGLRGNALFSFDPNNEQADIQEYFSNEYGRLRALRLGPDNNLYMTTSTRDGRGNPTAEDDRIIRVNPRALE